ncbi:MAG: tol-pal system YbgF family protein, partial [Candidatus Methanofastidiosia archaeon]
AICDGNLWSHRDVANFAWTKDQIEFLDNKKLALNILEWLTLKTKITNANKYFIQGNELLGLHQWEAAKEKYLSARTFSEKLEDETRIASIDHQISKCEDGIRADALFKEAESLYESEKFEEAKVKFEEAEKLYMGVGDGIKAQSARERISKIEVKLGSIKEALKIFEDAKEKFDAKNFTEAKREFERAGDRFIQLGEEELQLEAESYIYLCDQKIKARDDIDRYRTTIIIGGILILVLLIIYILLRRT